MRAGARAPGQAGAKAGLSGRVRLPAWCKASDSRIPPVASGVLCCRGPAGSQTRVLGSRLCEWLYHADCVGRTRASSCHSFPLLNIRFRFAPRHCVQRSRNVSDIKGPIEPPGDETSSRGSTTTAEGSRAGSVSSSRGERCGDQCV